MKTQTEVKGRIKKQEWFKLLPSYTKKSLLDLPESYLVFLLEQENVIVTTSDESSFTFGYNAEGKAVVRIPEFSASNIGVAKLLKLKLHPKEKIKFVIENVSLLERPFSDKNKKRIKKLLEKIGDESLWELGSLVEEKLRDIQLREKTGRFITPCLPGIEVDRDGETKRPRVMLENYSWLWQKIAFYGSVKMHLFTSLWKDNIPPIIYQIDCDCGKSTVVEAIGPFSALKIVESFPIDNPERYRFWVHKWGCKTTADEYCYCYENLTVRERRDLGRKGFTILSEICPDCKGIGEDVEAAVKYEEETGVTAGFYCSKCKGVGKI